MTAPEVVLEHLTLVAPLGLRFQDEALGLPVGQGLSVTIAPERNPSATIPLFPNRSGVYVLQHGPGLRALEQGAGNDAYWAALPAPRRFVVSVQDLSGRFLPCTLSVEAPTRGVYPWACGALASPLAGGAVPLFSSITRPAPAGMALVRGELADARSRAPAAWALIEATAPGQPPARGIADAAGRLALPLPYPEPAAAPLGSPLGGNGGATVPLGQQRWPLRIDVWYGALGGTPPPDLCRIVLQPPATAWADTSLAQPFPAMALTFGQEVVLRSGDAQTGRLLPTLLVTGAGSPL